MPCHHILTSLSHKTSKPVKHTRDSQTGAANTPGLLQYFGPALYNGHNYFSTLRLKLNYVTKKGLWHNRYGPRVTGLCHTGSHTGTDWCLIITCVALLWLGTECWFQTNLHIVDYTVEQDTLHYYMVTYSATSAKSGENFEFTRDNKHLAHRRATKCLMRIFWRKLTVLWSWWSESINSCGQWLMRVEVCEMNT